MPDPVKVIIFRLIVIVAVFGFSSPAMAQDGTPAGSVDFSGLLPAMVTLLLPLGLMLLMSSAMPEDEAPATAINLLVTWSVAALAYFAAGFAFHFGGIAQVSSQPALSGLYWEWYPLDQSVEAEVARLWGIVALKGWALSGEAITPAVLRLFLGHVSLVGVTAMIPVGSLPWRLRTAVSVLIGLVTGTLIYPLVGNWIWGGGWLASLGSSLGLGHGLVDFGGGSVIFLSASMVTLTALILLKPQPEPEEEMEPAEVVVTTGLDHRLTVYEETPASFEEVLPTTPMPSAYLPILSILGGGLMLLGWFGLTTGAHMPTALNFSPVQAAINGLLAALSGALTAAAYSWFTTRHLNPLMTTRGLVAGLVLASAGAPFLPIWIMIGAGLVFGLLLPPLIYLFNQALRLGDRLGALATYGVSAAIGLLLVALFADGRAGQGWNGVGPTGYLGVDGQGVSGLVTASGFAADWPGQFQAQLLGIGAVILWTLLVAFLFFQLITLVVQSWTRAGLELAGREEPAPAVLEVDPAGSSVEAIRTEKAELEAEDERPTQRPATGESVPKR